MAFTIGMYNVWDTIREDSGLKVETQYKTDIFMSNYNQTDDVILDFTSKLSSMPEVKHLNTAHSRYLSIDGNKIKGLFISPEEYENFFQLHNVDTGEKSKVPHNPNQVVVSEALATKGNIKVGDSLTFTYGEISYTVEVSEICSSV